MEQVLSSSTIISSTQIFPLKPHKTHLQTPTINLKFSISPKKNNHLHLSSFSSSCLCFSNKARATSTTPPPTLTAITSTPSSDNHHWMVLMVAPPPGVNSKPQVIEYYVKTLERVLGRWVCFKIFFSCHVDMLQMFLSIWSEILLWF